MSARSKSSMGRIEMVERSSLKRRMRGMSRMVMILIGSIRLLKITRMGRRAKRIRMMNRRDKLIRRVRKLGVEKQRCQGLKRKRN